MTTTSTLHHAKVTTSTDKDGYTSVFVFDEFKNKNYLGRFRRSADNKYWTAVLRTSAEVISARTKWELILWICRAEGHQFFYGEVYFQYGAHALMWTFH